MCSATSRVLVAASLHDAFVGRLVARAQATTVGAPEDDATMGPLISAAQKERVLDLLGRARAEGARVLCGEQGASVHDSASRPPAGPRETAHNEVAPIDTASIDTVPINTTHSNEAATLNGFYVAPTVVVDVTPGNVLWREEVFGPVVSVHAFTTESEAIDLANDSDYGLVATVVTADPTRGERVAAACEVGLVWINTPQLVFPQAGWGGLKRSGLGRELGPWGVRAFQEIKHVIQMA